MFINSGDKIIYFDIISYKKNVEDHEIHYFYNEIYIANICVFQVVNYINWAKSNFGVKFGSAGKGNSY